ncbi:hypothetical protein F8388_020782 [Cannabis sativa]|uniref:F-box domain-containing protein n=1 Tax=Cannabis sativa TaxID=3483 RepID=A0A7J6EXR4_CANSA|nr:hypothetical protein F8388_020782 [Cannabis sativa]
MWIASVMIIGILISALDWREPYTHTQRSSMEQQLSSLPEELWEDILSRLPVKNFVRCKCVDKSWCNLINTLTRTKQFKYYVDHRPSLHIETESKNSFVSICNHEEENDDMVNTIPVEDLNMLLVYWIQWRLEMVHDYKLALWKDSVVVFKYYDRRFHRHDYDYNNTSSACSSPIPSIQMWVMQHESSLNAYSWTKHLTFPPLDKIYYPIVFWTNDDLILSSVHDRVWSVSSYNLSTQKIRRLRGIPETLQRS